MLIDEKGEKLGLIKLEDAIQKAKDKDLDLVQVSPKDANPTVCKLMDYGKHMFTKKKNMSSSKKKVKRSSIKEIKFRPSTDTGDYQIK